MAEQIGEVVLKFSADTSDYDRKVQQARQTAIDAGRAIDQALNKPINRPYGPIPPPPPPLRLPQADTTALTAGLQKVQEQAAQTGRATEQAFTRTGQALQTASNGLQYYIDAQGRARDAGGRFITQTQLQAAGLEDLGKKSLTASEGLKELAIQLGALDAGRRALAFIVDQLKELDSSQAAVRTLGANSEELTTQLRALSDELGSSVSVNELLNASYDVLSSGFTSAADTTNILRASALASQGGFTDLATVVKAVNGVVNAYSLSSSNATKVVDQFLQTQNDGVITVGQYAEQIGDVASIAAAAGVSLAEVNAVIAAATLNTVQAPQAFTGLRQALSGILKPTQQATELAASLGLQFNAQALRAKGLTGVLADVQAKTGGAVDKLAILFESVEARSVVQVLFNKQLQEYNDLLAKNQQANGTAASAAEINGNTISGNVKKIRNAFSNLATTLDSTLNPVLGTLASKTSSVLNTLTKILSLVPKGVGTLNGAVVASMLFGPGVGIEVLRGQLGGGSSQPKPSASGGAQPMPQPPQQPVPQGAVLSPSERSFIEQVNAVQLRGLQDRLEVTRQLVGLDEAGRTALQNRLALSEKIRSVEQIRLQLQKEQAKPLGAGTGSPAEQDPKKILELQGKLQAGQVEVATLRIQNQQADAAALRTQQDRIRQQQLEVTLANNKLAITQQQTQLEREALTTGGQVSATDLLRLRTQEAITQKLEQQKAARQALQAELAKPANQQDRVVIDDLINKQAKANADVRQAYADAGLSLVQNARSAADSLKSAQQSFNSTARGSFDLLTSELQGQQIAVARQSVANAIGQGLIRGNVDIGTTEQLFRVAGVAESLTNANDVLKRAMDENAKATLALVQKDWNVYVNSGGSSPPPTPSPNQGLPSPRPYGVINGVRII